MTVLKFFYHIANANDEESSCYKLLKVNGKLRDVIKKNEEQEFD